MKLLKSVPSLFLAAVLMAVVPSSAYSVSADEVEPSATITVNTSGDVTANDGVCSLREAIIAANSNASSGGVAGECIAGSATGTDTIAFAANYTITLGSQLPAVTSTIAINGNGVANTIIQASTCNPITLPSGCTPASYRVFLVESSGSLTLNGLTVRHGNVTFTDTEVGGGIRNNGYLGVINSTITSNQSSSSGGGIFSFQNSTLFTSNSAISQNRGSLGGGIYLGSNATGNITFGTLISGNHAVNYGGGINNVGSLTLDNSTVNGNSADRVGGGIRNDSVLNVTRSAISNNTAGNPANPNAHGGGGIFNFGSGSLTVTDSTISGNETDEDGGGIYNFSSAVTINNSVLSGNTADLNGGGIFNNTSTNSLSVSNSTLSGNTAGIGGGIFNETGALLATNVTLSNNNALGSGGIRNEGGTLTLTNTTLSENGGFFSGGGLTNGGSGTLHLRNTLIANSTNGGDCINSGAISTNLNNLVEDGSCLATYSGDPSLGPLANNGGATQTHALLPDSTAINKGTNTGCPAADQRGMTRPQGAKCDIGAFEFVFPVYKSQKSNDGWIRESTETSGVGGTKNASASTLYLGDDFANRQYRTILSFNTSPMPDNAVITKVTLRVKRQGVTGGGNPVNMFNGFMADIKKGTFGTAALQLGDFKTAANKTVGPFSPSPSSGWYKINLTAGKNQINKTGLTQIRLRFRLDDNNNLAANFLKLYSGNAGAANRPQLIVEYYVP